MQTGAKTGASKGGNYGANRADVSSPLSLRPQRDFPYGLERPDGPQFESYGGYDHIASCLGVLLRNTFQSSYIVPSVAGAAGRAPGTSVRADQDAVDRAWSPDLQRDGGTPARINPDVYFEDSPRPLSATPH
ncbi:MAG: hypothetical protein ABJF23_24620 [Bryobacteraceae bacterium]